MRSFSSLGIGRGMRLIPAVLLLVAGAANAANIYIDEGKLDTDPAIVSTDSLLPLVITGSGPEWVSFAFTSTLPADPAKAGTYRIDMIEPPGSAVPAQISDTLVLQLQDGSPVIHGWFGSDPNLPQHTDFRLPSVIETGGWQLLAEYREQSGGGTVVDSFFARSDVEPAIPTPGAAIGGSVLLIGVIGTKLLRRQPRN